jgi:hypothetical protein
MVSAPLTRRWRLSYPRGLTNSFAERRLVVALSRHGSSCPELGSRGLNLTVP